MDRDRPRIRHDVQPVWEITPGQSLLAALAFLVAAPILICLRLAEEIVEAWRRTR